MKPYTYAATDKLRLYHGHELVWELPLDGFPRLIKALATAMCEAERNTSHAGSQDDAAGIGPAGKD